MVITETKNLKISEWAGMWEIQAKNFTLYYLWNYYISPMDHKVVVEAVSRLDFVNGEAVLDISGYYAKVHITVADGIDFSEELLHVYKEDGYI